jgi:holo-[acyl-carrier protein] synthase
MEELVAVGIDVVSVKRVEELLKRYGERALEKLLGEGASYCKKKRKGEFAGCVAARFALKEATVKAFSQVGIRLSIARVKVAGGGRELRLKVEEEHPYKLLFSISHEKEFAVAVVNLLRRKGG